VLGRARATNTDEFRLQKTFNISVSLSELCQVLPKIKSEFRFPRLIITHYYRLPLMKKRSKKRGKGSKAIRNPSSSAIAYHGRVFYPNEGQMADSITIVSKYASDLASTGAGVIANVFSNDPQNINDWSSLAAAYTDYRVLATAFEFYPSNKYSKTTTTTKAFCHVVNRQSSAALSSFNEAAAYESFKLLSLDDEVSFDNNEKVVPIVRMNGINEAEWKSTSAPATEWWHKLYTDNVSISTTFGIVIITYRLQFRGRR